MKTLNATLTLGFLILFLFLILAIPVSAQKDSRFDPTVLYPSPCTWCARGTETMMAFPSKTPNPLTPTKTLELIVLDTMTEVPCYGLGCPGPIVQTETPTPTSGTDCMCTAPRDTPTPGLVEKVGKNARKTQ